MSTATYSLIMFVLMTLIGIMSIVNYLRIRRAAAQRPDDPRIARMIRLRWIFILGIVCAFIAAGNALVTWIGLR